MAAPFFMKTRRLYGREFDLGNVAAGGCDCDCGCQLYHYFLGKSEPCRCGFDWGGGDDYSGILNQAEAVSGIDFNTLALLVGMMMIVAVSEKSGIFQFVAIWAAKKVKASPRGLLAALALVTALFSGFLDNVTTVLLIAPVTFQVTRKLKVSPYPYLLVEIFASNIGGTATLIGDPPNILIGSALNLTFMDFVYNLAPVVLTTMVVLVAAFDFFWKRSLVASDENRKIVMKMNEFDAITDRPLLFKCLVVLALVIAGFISAKEIGLENGTIALLGAAVLLFLYTLGTPGEDRDGKVQEIFGMVDWITISFLPVCL